MTAQAGSAATSPKALGHPNGCRITFTPQPDGRVEVMSTREGREPWSHVVGIHLARGWWVAWEREGFKQLEG